MHGWQRGPNPPILWIHLSVLPTHPFSNFVQPPIPHPFLPPPTPTPYYSSCCLVSLGEWVIAPHLILLNDIMDVHMSSLRTLMRVLRNQASNLLKSNAWCGFLLVLWFDVTYKNTHIKKHTAHSGASRLTRPYIFTPTLMCSQQLALLHWMNNLLMSKLHFPQCRFFSKMIHLQKSCCLLIRCYRS